MATKYLTALSLFIVLAGCAGINGPIEDAEWCSGGVLPESSCSMPDMPIQAVTEPQE